MTRESPSPQQTALASAREDRRPGRSLPGQNKEPSVRTLVVCSGGLDSVTLSHKIVIEKTLIHLVSFDYGQRHRKELDYARRCATRLGITHDIIDITDIGRRLIGSALTDGTAVSDRRYCAKTQQAPPLSPRHDPNLLLHLLVAPINRAAAPVSAGFRCGELILYHI